MHNGFRGWNGRNAHHPSTSSKEVTNAWIKTSTSLNVFVTLCVIIASRQKIALISPTSCRNTSTIAPQMAGVTTDQSALYRKKQNVGQCTPRDHYTGVTHRCPRTDILLPDCLCMRITALQTCTRISLFSETDLK